MKHLMDIVSPLPQAFGHHKYLLIFTNYFMKWDEAEPYAEIKDANVESII